MADENRRKYCFQTNYDIMKKELDKNSRTLFGFEFHYYATHFEQIRRALPKGNFQECGKRSYLLSTPEIARQAHFVAPDLYKKCILGWRVIVEAMATIYSYHVSLFRDDENKACRSLYKSFLYATLPQFSIREYGNRIKYFCDKRDSLFFVNGMYLMELAEKVKNYEDARGFGSASQLSNLWGLWRSEAVPPPAEQMVKNRNEEKNHTALRKRMYDTYMPFFSETILSNGWNHVAKDREEGHFNQPIELLVEPEAQNRSEPLGAPAVVTAAPVSKSQKAPDAVSAAPRVKPPKAPEAVPETPASQPSKAPEDRGTMGFLLESQKSLLSLFERAHDVDNSARRQQSGEGAQADQPTMVKMLIDHQKTFIALMEKAQERDLGKAGNQRVGVKRVRVEDESSRDAPSAKKRAPETSSSPS